MNRRWLGMVWRGERDRGTCRSSRQIKIVYWDFHFVGDYLKAARLGFFLRLALAQKPQDWRRWPLDTPRTLDTFREGFHFWPTRTGSELVQAWTLRAESLAPKFARIRIGIGIHIGVSPGRRYTYLNLLRHRRHGGWVKCFVWLFGDSSATFHLRKTGGNVRNGRPPTDFADLAGAA